MSDFEEFKQAEKSGWEAQGGRYHLGVENFTTIATPVLLEMAQVGKGQKLAILPAAYGLEELSEATSNFDTVVLMKVSPVIVKALAELEGLGLTENSTYVRRVSTEHEKVIRDVTAIKEEDMDYFSLLIVKGNPSEYPKAES